MAHAPSVSSTYEEQQPAMRSVVINPAASHHRTILFDAPLQRVDPGTTTEASIKTASSPTITPKQHSPQYLSKKPVLTKKSLSDPSVAGPKKSNWTVEHATLKARPSPTPTTPCALPPPQKCTSRLVQYTSADIISGRIATTLQARSIKAKYCRSAAKCRTLDFVKFYIRLYVVPPSSSSAHHGIGDGDNGEGGVLVELQRVSGDYLSFMYDCRAILDAAEGKDVIMDNQDAMMNNHHHCLKNNKAIYLRLPVSEMSFACKDDIVLRHDHKTEQDDEDIINITSELLSSHQSDSNMLGMESLVSLLDVTVTSKSTALLAAKRLVCTRHQSDDGHFSLHNYVMSLIIYDVDHEDEDNNDDDSSLEEDATSPIKLSLNASIAEHTRRLRTYALSSLSNALALLYSENILCDTISASSKEWYASVLIPRLIDNVKCAASNPHDATLAARCLASLAKCSHVFSSKMKACDGCNDVGGCMSALRRAGEIGRDNFELLLRDCELCQSILSQC